MLVPAPAMSMVLPSALPIALVIDLRIPLHCNQLKK
jgi:hypothetical protein